MLRLLKLFFILLPLSAYALESDNTLPIQITADSTVYNYKTGITQYEGNIKIDQGTTHLTADRLTTQMDDHHKLEEAIAYGLQKLATYSTIPNPGDTELVAKAKIIKFSPKKFTVVLENDVIIVQGKNSFQGNLIIYNTKDRIINAPAMKNSRSTLVFEPQQLHS